MFHSRVLVTNPYRHSPNNNLDRTIENNLYQRSNKIGFYGITYLCATLSYFMERAKKYRAAIILLTTLSLLSTTL